jgi:hypothetical protein
VRRILDLEINGFIIRFDCVAGCWWMVNSSILDLILLAFSFNWVRVKRDDVVLDLFALSLGELFFRGSLRELILKKLISTNSCLNPSIHLI